MNIPLDKLTFPSSRSNTNIFKPCLRHKRPSMKRQRRSYDGHHFESVSFFNPAEAVKLPEGEDLFEWLAKNVDVFYRQVSMLFSVLTELCTQQSCPCMSAGDGYKYLWSDGDGEQPTELSAPEYLNRLLEWINTIIEDERIFPSAPNAPFPSEFMTIVKNIMRRLFRFYAHCYYHHLKDFRYLGMGSLLDTSFKHFILFSQEFNLIPEDQLEPLRDLIDSIRK